MRNSIIIPDVVNGVDNIGSRDDVIFDRRDDAGLDEDDGSTIAELGIIKDNDDDDNDDSDNDSDDDVETIVGTTID